MKVAFDPQTFLRQRTGGISRLFTDLIRSFDSDASLGVEAITPFRWINNTYAWHDLPGRSLKRPPSWVPREVLYAPWFARGLRVSPGIDAIHHTYYDRRFLKPIGPAARVSTIHDMIPEKFAGTEKFTGSHLAKSDYVSHSDLIICVSEATRADLDYYLRTPPGKVVVIPNAVQPEFQPGLPRCAKLPSVYMLYVGKREGYKDFPILPAAMAELQKRSLSCKVVVVGPPFNRREVELFRRYGVTSLFEQHSLNDAQLRGAYANCKLLVQTSRYEGFGMTPLEGMASGAPVVVARSSAMPEVGGDVARYFEPGSAESLAVELEVVLNDAALRSDLGVRGVERAQQFTTQLMAERTAAAYRSAISTS